ncbi:MAG: diacylglycerol kinase family protein [Ilumatobacter sp.]|uniref:diacylglycerol/lipid kinase family protein n=1 Tax=Ilumatobacter sp. TaxID=1967498 RepID=UPI003296CAE3
MSSVVAIWNPASGSASDESKLREALGGDVELVETTADDPGTGQAERAVADGAAIVVACGGDGTVRACLDPLAGSDTALAIVPLGTGNLLASNLGIPSGLAAGAGVGRDSARTIDLGRVNGEAFAVMAGSGFDALMIRDANTSIKSRLGTVAYVFSGLKNLRRDAIGTTVTVDGEMWFDGTTTMVLVGNFGEISGGIVVFPDARPDDGILDIAVMSASTMRQWATVAWKLIRKRPHHGELARLTTGSHVVVELDQPRAYELDGEDREPATRLEFGIEPGAITIHHSMRTDTKR